MQGLSGLILCLSDWPMPLEHIGRTGSGLPSLSLCPKYSCLLLLQCCEDALAASGAFVDVVVGGAVLDGEVAWLPAVFTLGHVFPLFRMASAQTSALADTVKD